jgi:hypothetical protein
MAVRATTIVQARVCACPIRDMRVSEKKSLGEKRKSDRAAQVPVRVPATHVAVKRERDVDHPTGHEGLYELKVRGKEGDEAVLVCVSQCMPLHILLLTSIMRSCTG